MSVEFPVPASIDTLSIACAGAAAASVTAVASAMEIVRMGLFFLLSRANRITAVATRCAGRFAGAPARPNRCTVGGTGGASPWRARFRKHRPTTIRHA